MTNKFSVHKNKFLPILIFSFFFLIYLSSNGGHLDYYDGTSAFLMTENFILHGTPSNISINSPSLDSLDFDIERHMNIQGGMRARAEFDRNESMYLAQNMTKKQFVQEFLKELDREKFPNKNYLVLPILASPLYLLSSVFNISPIHFVPLFLNSIILAVNGVLIFLISKKIFSTRIGFTLSIIFGVTSFIWPYAGTMLARPIAIVFLLLSIYLIITNKEKKNSVLTFFTAVSVGLSFLSHTSFLFLFPGIVIFGIWQFRKSKKQISIFLIGLIIMILIQGYLNYERFGSVDDIGIGGAGIIWEKISITGIIGHLFSPGRSIFLYFPLSILFPAAIYFLYKIDKSLAILFLYLSVVGFVYISLSDARWSFSEWGSHRYHLSIIPIVTITLGSIIVNFSRQIKVMLGIIVLSIIGFFVNLFAVLVGYENIFHYGHYLISKFLYGPGGFTLNSYYSPAILSVQVLLTDWVSTKPITEKIGLIGCNYDLYFYCEYGIFSILLLSVLIVIIGFTILQIIKTPQKSSKIINL